MFTPSRLSGAVAFPAVLLSMLCALLLSPGAAHAHIRLDESSPGRDEVVRVMPSHLRLLFSARIEARYTSVTLTAPDGATVPTGDVVFTAGSDREITLVLPSLTQPGVYTVRWRTAGADGHVLEGSYDFVLAPDSAGDQAGDSARAPAAVDTGAASASAEEDMHAHHDEPEPVGGVGEAFGRGLHFVALLLLLGGVTFRAVLLPRIGAGAAAGALQRSAWRWLAAAAVLLGISAVVRLWLQSIALHGSERAWDTALLSIMLTDTAWGRAWLMQAVLFALLGMAIAWARPGRDRKGLAVAVVAVLGLATIPALSGHAAGLTGNERLIVLNDTIHVVAAGAWIGTLAILMIGAIPILRRMAGDGTAADAIDRFSPLALAAGAAVVLSGLVNSIAHLQSVPQLWTTGYGRVLLVKLLLIAGVAAAGFVNWRLVRPRLRTEDGMRRLRLAASAELTFAFLVIIATAVLTGQPRP